MSEKLPVHLKVLAKGDLESLCVNCGLCCYAAVPIAKGLNVLVPELRCKYLVNKGTDGETCCSVYEDRFEKAGAWCLPLGEAIAKGIFPNSCPYVKDMPGYVGKAILDDKTLNLVMPSIRKAITSQEQPRWLSDRDWTSFSEKK